MASRRVELGETGHRVRENIRQVRRSRGLTLRGLSERLVEHPLPDGALSQIEHGARRVDVDDLTALADALNVSPADLLGTDGRPVDERIRAAVNAGVRHALTHYRAGRG